MRFTIGLASAATVALLAACSNSQSDAAPPTQDQAEAAPTTGARSPLRKSPRSSHSATIAASASASGTASPRSQRYTVVRP